MRKWRLPLLLVATVALGYGCGAASDSGGTSSSDRSSGEATATSNTSPSSTTMKKTASTTQPDPPQSTTVAPSTTTVPPTVPPSTAAPKNIELADVLNMQVPGDTCNWLVDETGPQLTNGKSDVVNGANFELVTDGSTFTDFTGDGAGDALLSFYCDGGGNDLWGSLVVMIADGPTYVIPESAVLDTSGLPAGTTMEWYGAEWDGQHAVLEWGAVEPDGATCCPRYELQTTGTIDATGFHAISTDGDDALTGGEYHHDATAPPASDSVTGEWATFFDVPQLGQEPVLGSGCGADGSIGETIPDGWWYGVVTSIATDSIEFDLVCIYYGDSAAEVISECAGTLDRDSESWADCVGGWGEDFFPQNNNERTRSVQLKGGAAVDPADPECRVDDESQLDDRLSLVHVVDGQAVSIAYHCGGG